MILKVIWTNATRPESEKRRAEEAYAERLLDMFETAQRAADAKEEWHRMQEPPIHHWTTYNRIAHICAVTGMLPSERAMAHFIVRFEK